MSSSRIVDIKEIRSDNNEWKGTFLALHEDGSFSRVESGDEDGAMVVRVTPLKVVA